jgi:hypothetical protein
LLSQVLEGLEAPRSTLYSVRRKDHSLTTVVGLGTVGPDRPRLEKNIRWDNSRLNRSYTHVVDPDGPCWESGLAVRHWETKDTQ